MLTRDQREESLIVFYFGRDEDYLTRCRENAYRDFQRTLRGIAKLARAEEAYSRADEALQRQLTAIRDTAPPTQEHFDTWHRSTCSELAAIYEDCGYCFTVGQAQKSINMPLKYIHVIGRCAGAWFRPSLRLVTRPPRQDSDGCPPEIWV
jgi:hypothetical protein